MAYQIIRVTDKHIRAARKVTKIVHGMLQGLGVKPSCSVCPVAQAIHEQTENKNVSVFPDEIVRDMGCGFNEEQLAPVPRSVARFIRRFDRGEKVKPFNFKLVWK